jgi:hypothetical protein
MTKMVSLAWCFPRRFSCSVIHVYQDFTPHQFVVISTTDEVDVCSPLFFPSWTVCSIFPPSDTAVFLFFFSGMDFPYLVWHCPGLGPSMHIHDSWTCTEGPKPGQCPIFILLLSAFVDPAPCHLLSIVSLHHVFVPCIHCVCPHFLECSIQFSRRVFGSVARVRPFLLVSCLFISNAPIENEALIAA